MENVEEHHKTSSIKKLTISRGGWLQLNKREGRKCEYSLEVETDEKHFAENFNFYDLFLKNLVTKVLSIEKEVKDSEVGERVKEQETSEGDPNNVEWKDVQGPKGPFQVATNENQDTISLTEKLRKTKTFTRGGYFYWLLPNGTIARKQVRDLGTR